MLHRREGEMSEHESVADLLDERARLLAIGYRMLGSRAEAEDAVQDTYVRWYRLTDEERDAIRVPAAWLTTTMTRVCLNVLGSARHRRETYVGQWLPEPVAPDAPIGHVDPADRVTLDEEVTMALMVVLESMTPAERVAFVLHDLFAYTFDEVAEMVGRSPQACRKLASTARQHVAEQRRRTGSAAQHRRVVEAFVEAAQTGDVAALVAHLDPDAVAVSDGGGRVRAALRPVVGADKVARFLLGVMSKSTDLGIELEHAAGESRLVVRREGEVAVVASFGVDGERVSRVWLVLNPEKLGTWEPHTPTDSAVEQA